jgi:hypothetical protein
MHFFRAVVLVALVVSAAPAFADNLPVSVAIPVGLHAGAASEAGPAGQKYVSVEDLQIANPSSELAQSYTPAEFHLLIDEKTYLPVVRPGLAAIDLSEGSVLGPREQVRVTVTFLVPARTTSAKFEFTPHWYDDAGFTVDWCCEYP